ncbi:MAG: glycosyltransferase family 2 protein [Actinobacteria bacterium]|nr:glycosyltransferase family 2 protein [Actinomycetota bacterium]
MTTAIASEEFTLSIIIVSYNTKDLLLDCLKHLNFTESERLFEIIVSDNDSSDGTEAAVRKDFPHVTFVQNGANLGFGAAVNKGAEKASGRYLMILNPDTIVLPATIDRMLAYLEESEGDRVVSCRLFNGNRTVQLSCARFPTPGRIFFLYSRLDLLFRSERFQLYYEKLSIRRNRIITTFPDLSPQKVDTVLGACFVIPRRLFAKVGGFDERYFMHYEEVDLFRSLRELKAAVYFLPDVGITHYGGQSTVQDYVNMRFEQQRSLLIYLSKWHGVGAARFIRSMFVIIGLFRFAKFGADRLLQGDKSRETEMNYDAARFILAGLIKLDVRSLAAPRS